MTFYPTDINNKLDDGMHLIVMHVGSHFKIQVVSSSNAQCVRTIVYVCDAKENSYTCIILNTPKRSLLNNM